MAFCYDNGTTFNEDVPATGLPVTKDAVVTEIIETAETFLRDLVAAHPDLDDYHRTEELRGELQEAKRVYREYANPDDPGGR